MPTYEYECTGCGHKFDLFQKITDKPIKKCPKCSGAVRRLIGSGAGIIFKGSGFYATDYKKKSGSQSENQAAKPKPNTCPNPGGCSGCG